MRRPRLQRLKTKITEIILLSTLYSLLSTLFVGCGYTTRSMVGSSYSTIYITPFINKVDITQETDIGNKYKIYRPKLETDVTKAVVDKFLFDGNLRPAAKETADVVLAGELVEFRKDPVRYDDSDEVSEYRINMVVNLALTKRETEETVWREERFTGDSTYFVTGSQAKTESAAITDAIKDLARRIVERTVEQW